MCDFGSQSALKNLTFCSPLYERNVYESTSTCRQLSFYFFNTAHNNRSPFASVFLHGFRLIQDLLHPRKVELLFVGLRFPWTFPCSSHTGGARKRDRERGLTFEDWPRTFYFDRNSRGRIRQEV